VTDTIQVGAWIDGPQPGPGATALDSWASLIVRDCGITSPVIVTNVGIKPLYLSRWKVDHLRDAISALRSAGAEEVGIMVWPAATADAIDALVKDVSKIYGTEDPDGVPRMRVPDYVCIDAEGRYNSTGWGPAGAVLADRLCDGLEEAQKGHSLTYLSVTAIPPRQGLRLQDASLIRHPAVQVATPQAYSQYQGPNHWSANPYFRVGPIQRGTWATWSPLLEDGHVSAIKMGCAIYAQDHPTGPTGIEALRQAADICIQLGARRLCYWSFKHFRSASKVHAERRAFLRELSQTLCPDPSEGLSFADALDQLVFGDGQYSAMARLGCLIKHCDTTADDWELIKPDEECES
jgi:hypothetical protein